ncbi:hypothetical protein Hanom_Chr17g01536811 [Helianthus anomalus]
MIFAMGVVVWLMCTGDDDLLPMSFFLVPSAFGVVPISTTINITNITIFIFIEKDV